MICPNRLDPVARRSSTTTSLWPTSPGNAGWQGNIPTPFDFDEFLGKADYQLNAAHRLSVSYFNTGGTSTTRAAPATCRGASRFDWRQHSVNASDVWILECSKINQVWLTFSRNFGGRINNPRTSLTDLGSNFAIQGAPNLPQITVTGYFTLGQRDRRPDRRHQLLLGRDVFSWTKGNHSLKLGGELSLNKDIQQTLLNNYGVFTFNNSVTVTRWRIS